MGDAYKLISLAITSQSNELYVINFDKITEFIIPIHCGDVNIRHIFDFVFGKSVKNLPIHQTKLIVGNDANARKEFIRLNDGHDSCFIDQKRFTLKMYAEHCEEELRICYHTNCGLLYPETIKKVLNLNRNDDLKDYLEGISESVKWKALHNLLQSNINPLKRQLMDLKCMKMLLTNASVNNERVGAITEHYVRYGLFHSAKMIENEEFREDNRRFDEAREIELFDPTQLYEQINLLESNAQPINREKLIAQNRISYYDGLAKTSLDEQDDYEDLLGNIRYLKECNLSASSSDDSRSFENTHSEAKNNFFNTFVECLANMPEYYTEIPQGNAEYVDMAVLQNRAHEIDEQMEKIKCEWDLVRQMIATKQLYQIEIEKEKSKVNVSHDMLRKHRDLVLNGIQWEHLNSVLRDFPEKEHVYGQLNDILVSKDPQLIKAITLAMKSYENAVFVKNEGVRQQLKQYLIDKKYFSCKSIVAVDDFETNLRSPTPHNQNYSKLIDCIDIKFNKGEAAHLRQILSVIFDNIVVCNTRANAVQTLNEHPELSTLSAEGVIWNKEVISICRQYMQADRKRATNESHIAHWKLNYELLHEIKNNDLALKRKSIYLKASYRKLQDAKHQIEQKIEKQSRIEASQSPNSSPNIRHDYQMAAEQMFNDFCRANNISSIIEFDINYEPDRTMVDANIARNNKSYQILQSKEQIKQAILESQLQRNKRINQCLQANKQKCEELDGIEIDKELNACRIELITAEAKNRCAIASKMVEVVTPPATFALINERESKRFFEHLNSVLELEHDNNNNNNNNNGYFDNLPVELQQLPAETCAQTANNLKHFRDKCLAANERFGAFSMKKWLILQTLIDRNKQEIRQKNEELRNYLTVYDHIIAHRRQLFENVFYGAGDEIDNIYKQLYGSADYSAELLPTVLHGLHWNDINVSFQEPMFTSFHIFNSEESVMAAISMILAIVQNKKWPILFIDLIRANLKLENAHRVVQYVDQCLLTPGKVQQIIIFTDHHDVVNALRSEKQNYLTWSNGFEGFVAATSPDIEISTRNTGRQSVWENDR